MISDDEPTAAELLREAKIDLNIAADELLLYAESLAEAVEKGVGPDGFPYRSYPAKETEALERAAVAYTGARQRYEEAAIAAGFKLPSDFWRVEGEL
jgi:hypothetical protein